MSDLIGGLARAGREYRRRAEEAERRQQVVEELSSSTAGRLEVWAYQLGLAAGSAAAAVAGIGDSLAIGWQEGRRGE